MRLRLTLLTLATLTAACVHETRVAKSPAAPVSATPTVWERQIRNAHDAGDGDYQLRALRERVAAEPNDIPVRLELVKAYQQRGFPDVALEMCRLAAARFPASGEVQLALVRSLRDLNRRAEATAGLEAFLHQHPQTGPEYSSWLGILRDEAGQWEAGEPFHRQAVALAPSSDFLHNNLGYNLLMQKKNGEAAAEFREALRLNPASQIAHNNLGLALAGENASEAVANWQAASDPATAHNNLAAVLIEKGNYPAARKELEIALGYNKAHPAALKNLELVSRLDGGPVLLHVKPSYTRWDRWKTGFKRLFVGPLDQPRTEESNASTSASVTGEER